MVSVVLMNAADQGARRCQNLVVGSVGLRMEFTIPGSMACELEKGGRKARLKRFSLSTCMATGGLPVFMQRGIAITIPEY